MSIILNSVELLRYQGSGIKYFSQALLQAIHGSMPVELLLETKRKERSSVLAQSNLFNVHSSGSGRAAALKRQVKQSVTHYIPGRFIYKAPVVSRLDPLSDLALARVPLGSPSSGDRDLLFRASKDLYANAQAEYARSGHCSEVIFPDLDSRSSQGLLFHNPLPFPLIPRNAKMVVTVHDLIPLSHPELCLDDPGRFYELVSELVDASVAVHAISQYTADLLVNMFGDPIRAKLKVVPQALTVAVCSPEQDEDVVREKLLGWDRFRNGDGNYPLLQLGTLEPKKNHATTLEVHRILRQRFPHLKLVVIGKSGWLCDDLEASLLAREGVEWIRSAPRSSVQWHLNNSLVMMFPSLVEGWGLPPLEAMAAGTPVACSSIDACREACGEGAAGLVSPYDVEGFSQLLLDLLSDRERYAHAVRAGLRQARLYSRERFRSEMLSLYNAALQRGD